jgi:hypothetical protein
MAIFRTWIRRSPLRSQDYANPRLAQRASSQRRTSHLRGGNILRRLLAQMPQPLGVVQAYPTGRADRLGSELNPAIAVTSLMSDPNDPERGDLGRFAISVMISLALVVLALRVYAELGMI